MLDSLDDAAHNVDLMNDDELGAELERRHQEMIAEPSMGITWEEVRARVLVELEQGIPKNDPE